MKKEKNLPENWAKTELEEISDSVSTSGKKIKTKDALPSGKYPVIDQGVAPVSGYINDSSLVVPASIDNAIVIFGDHTRIVKYVMRDFVPGADGTKLIRARNGINSRYLKYLIQQADIPDRGYGRHYQFLKSANLSLAPEKEQRRIADKLDTTLARVDALNDRLARITPLLKRFRQSVLAAATSGKLTEDFDFKGGFSTWERKMLIDVCLKITDGEHISPKKIDDGIPLLTAKNVLEGRLDFSVTDFVSSVDAEKFWARCKPELNDILICSRGTIGRCSLVKENSEFCLMGTVILVKANKKNINPDYLFYCIASPIVQEVLKGASGATAVSALYLRDIKKLELLLPHQEEQAEIVRRVETLFAFADRLEARLQSAQTGAERLTPALLAKAFRGELVSQDPSDEPATELLRRLREARAAQVPAKPKRGRKAATAGQVAGA